MNKYEKSRQHYVYQDTRIDRLFIVKSCTSGNLYEVVKALDGGYYCNCRWGQENERRPCSHILAVSDVKKTIPRRTHSVEVKEDGAIVVTYYTKEG